MLKIPTVTLNNGVTMPQLGLGVFLIPNEEAEKTVTTALENEYRLIDTAAKYENEEGVGAGIKKSGIPREELFITTKLWNSEHKFENALKAFDASLNRLGLDYIDLYLIHWPLPMEDNYIEAWKALEKIYKEGRTKAIGLSNFNPNHMDKVLKESEVNPTVLQIELHPLFTQNETRQYAKEHNIQVESWYPLGGQNSKDELLSLPLLTELAKKYSKTPAQIVLRWHTQLGLVVIPKSTNPDRIKENIHIFDFELSEEEVSSITALNKGVRLGSDPETASFK